MGEYLLIEGGRPLKGTVRLPAAKNSVLPLLAAALMCSGESFFTQVPELSDVHQSILILRALGCRCQRRGRGLAVQPQSTEPAELPEGPARAMRSSVFYLAPALHRCGQIRMPLPGGCRLGARPIDIHLEGLSRMGAVICWEDEWLKLTAPQRLTGTDYALRLPSVGATETLLMAGVLAKGETVLRGAAMEPEICDLVEFLRKCGARITGEGTPMIRIRGTDRLSGAVHTPIPDRIVAATAAAAAASAGGQLELLGCRPETLGCTLSILTEAGCEARIGKNSLILSRQQRLRAPHRLFTSGWPGFSTDAAPLVAAALLTAAGRTELEDRIFENRFACAQGFCAMGARAAVHGRSLWISGVDRLCAAQVRAQDLRGGAALIVAALAAAGESRVEGLAHILRGYEKPERMLAEMGAKARLIKTG